jgi:hypothetical protein
MNLVLLPKLKDDLLDPVLRQRTGSSLGGDELKQVRIVLKRRWALIRSMVSKPTARQFPPTTTNFSSFATPSFFRSEMEERFWKGRVL